MSVPEVIPVAYEPDYRTPTIGRWDGGQFLASVTAAFPEGLRTGDDGKRHKRWYAVLHRFDAAGRHLESRIESTGTTADGERRAVEAARELLGTWLDALPGRRYESVAVAPFAVRCEGALFGLVVEGHSEDEDDEEGNWVELYPDGLGFSAPWDGTYDT
ncbi:MULTISPECIES: hypothetical protein [Streptomyces]|uniref:Formate hydrogenlyase regulatory protein HycA n=2 Tax=Streptomyces TaxID=1883 RepID=A0ABU4K9X1_9ACTN|nr:hypothetical protein [Streptomyces roseolus]MDX2294175.1 hypothetical protein [Streptomyces roseolus]